MAGLQTTEAELNRLIYDIYQAATQPDLWESTFDTLRRTVDAAASWMATPFVQPGEGGLVVSRQVGPGCIAEQRSFLARPGPWFTAWERMGRPVERPLVCSELIPARRSAHSSFYRGWLQPRDLLDVTTIVVYDGSLPDAPFMLAQFGRSPTQERFQRDQLTVLAQVAPHVRRALDIGRMMAHAQERQAIQAVLDAIPLGLVRVRPDGLGFLMNRRAETILSRADGLRMRGGRLEAVWPDDQRRLQRLIATALYPQPGTPMDAGGQISLLRPSGQGWLAITATPLRGESGLSLGAGPVAALVQISDGTERPAVAAEWLRARYGLTPAEADIMGALVQGDSVADIAARRGSQVSTVRVQVERIFSKTGVRRQAELVKLGLASNAWIRSGN